jgi:hypothetical protein
LLYNTTQQKKLSKKKKIIIKRDRGRLNLVQNYLRNILYTFMWLVGRECEIKLNTFYYYFQWSTLIILCGNKNEKRTILRMCRLTRRILFDYKN